MITDFALGVLVATTIALALIVAAVVAVGAWLAHQLRNWQSVGAQRSPVSTSIHIETFDREQVPPLPYKGEPEKSHE